MSGEETPGPAAPPAPPDATDHPLSEPRKQARLLDAWRMPRGWRVISEVNNNVVGLWYTIAAFAFFLFAGVLALLMRAQLALPENDVLGAKAYNQVFTMHGTVMMFLFAIPIFEAFSIQILPQMLGTRDLPFPRLSAYGFWCFVIGGVFVCSSLFFGIAPEGGWFMYPPLTTEYQAGVGPDIWLLGLSFIEIASIAAAVELIVGVLKTRAPGMRINLIPLYSWYILVVAVMILFAFPPLIAGDLMFELQRAADWPFFDPARGGDPLLWQHLFWIFGHPEVYIIFLPSVALLAMIVPAFAQRPLYGYTWIVLAAVGTGFLSFGLWVHHMYTTGLPGISLALFSSASIAVALPTGVQIFALLGTVLAGRVIRSVPMLYALGALVIFVLGGLTGVMVALAPFDFQAHDTYFVVGHLHYVLIGGMLFPIFAGLHYYFPFISGKLLSERLGRIAFWLKFVGFNLGFLPMHLAGLYGMPRRVYTWRGEQGLDWPNLLSTIGAYVFALGVALLVFDVIRVALGRSRRSPRNPWNAGTLEWLTEMPGQPWSVRSIPIVTSRYPLWDDPDYMRRVDAGEYYLADALERRRETMLTSIIDAVPEQCLRVPGPTFLTLIAAAFTGASFIFLTFSWYVSAIVTGLIAIVFILIWLWTGTALQPDVRDKDVGLGLRLPLYVSGPKSVGWWAMFITMIGDLTAYASLVFGYLFYWTAREDFPPPGAGDPGSKALLAGGTLALLGWALTLAARHLNRRDANLAFHACNGIAALVALGSALALLAGPWSADLDPTAHVYPATVWLLVLWTAVHLAVAALMNFYCTARRIAGRMTAEHDIDIHNVALYWHFALLTAVTSVALIVAFPRLV